MFWLTKIVAACQLYRHELYYTVLIDLRKDRKMNGKLEKTERKLWVLGMAALGAGLLAVPDLALAGHIRTEGRRAARRVWVPPVYESRARTVTGPAVCDERPREIWREPLYETRRILVEVPAEVVTERMYRYDAFGGSIGLEFVEKVVRPARHVWQEERALVRAGYYETVYERVCVRPERTWVVYDKVLVRRGHWAISKGARIHKARHRHGLPRLGRPDHRHDRGVQVAVRFGR